MTTLRLPALIVILAVLGGVAAPVTIGAADPDAREINEGRRAAQQMEAQYKVVSGPAADRVALIGKQLAPLSERPTLPWTFKVVELDDPNAVALPGGFVYVTKGMLGFVRSDHELAAVLAHEVAHTNFRHQMELMRRYNQATFVTILIALITRDPRLAQGAQLVSYGLLAGYTRDMERQADLASIGYLARSPYSPVGALTVMERLRREETLRGLPDPGDFRDHPRTAERVSYIEAELRRRGIPIVRRTAANFLRVSTRTVTENGREIAELYVNDALIVRLPDAPRVAGMAGALDQFFDLDPYPGQVRDEEVLGVIEIVGGRITLLRIRPEHASFYGLSPRDLAAAIVSALRKAIEQDLEDRRRNG